MATKKKTGRPSDYTQEKADFICAELAMGKSLRTVLEEGKNKGLPSMPTVFKWMRENEDFLNQYARAKEESADAMADEILDISDDGHNDWMERRYGSTEVWVENGEAINRSRLRVDTRKWIMAKMKPKKYGDKLDVTSGGKRVQSAPVIISQIAPRTPDDASPTEGETSQGS